jgi:hypothetical protein
LVVFWSVAAHQRTRFGVVAGVVAKWLFALGLVGLLAWVVDRKFERVEVVDEN